MLYVTNALPGSVLAGADVLKFIKISAAQAAEIIEGSLEWVSAVGHADTAALFSAQLGREISFNRISIDKDFFARTSIDRRVPYNNQILAGVYSGPRLPEGSTTLPEGASIQWVLVTPVKMWGGEWHVAKEHKVTY